MARSSIELLTKDDYKRAFLALHPLTSYELALLRAHYRASEHTLTASELAKAVGYKSHSGANLRYGNLAGKLCEVLGCDPRLNVHVLVTDFKDEEHWHLALRPQVVSALRELGWSGFTARSAKRLPQRIVEISHDARSNSANPRPIPPLYVFKCNVKDPSAGDWSYFFDKMKGRGRWGGTWCIKNSASRNILLNRLRVGDLILAWQSDKQVACGLCRVSKLKTNRKDTSVFLATISRFDPPVRLLAFKAVYPGLANGKAFQQGRMGTLFDTTRAEAQAILAGCGITKIDVTDSAEQDQRFLEGEGRATTTTVRNAKLREAAKAQWGSRCYCCGFAFGEFYGPFAAGAAIVHHLETFTKRKRRKSTVDDVRVVCANCHYAIHMTDPPMDVDDLRRLLSKSWKPWSGAGVTRKCKTRRRRGVAD
jgi:hypothetical protein